MRERGEKSSKTILYVCIAQLRIHLSACGSNYKLFIIIAVHELLKVYNFNTFFLSIFFLLKSL